jgi:hypothetical protein
VEPVNDGLSLVHSCVVLEGCLDGNSNQVRGDSWWCPVTFLSLVGWKGLPSAISSRAIMFFV